MQPVAHSRCLSKNHKVHSEVKALDQTAPEPLAVALVEVLMKALPDSSVEGKTVARAQALEPVLEIRSGEAAVHGALGTLAARAAEAMVPQTPLVLVQVEGLVQVQAPEDRVAFRAA